LKKQLPYATFPNGSSVSRKVNVGAIIVPLKQQVNYSCYSAASEVCCAHNTLYESTFRSGCTNHT